jgi:hypothetical protein
VLTIVILVGATLFPDVTLATGIAVKVSVPAVTVAVGVPVIAMVTTLSFVADTAAVPAVNPAGRFVMIKSEAVIVPQVKPSGEISPSSPESVSVTDAFETAAVVVSASSPVLTAVTVAICANAPPPNSKTPAMLNCITAFHIDLVKVMRTPLFENEKVRKS